MLESFLKGFEAFPLFDAWIWVSFSNKSEVDDVVAIRTSKGCCNNFSTLDEKWTDLSSLWALENWL